MSRIKEKISAIVGQQLPEFVRSDYTTFVSFLEAYYRFLEQDQNAQEIIQNAKSYSDIDKTASSFVAYFLKQYGTLIPANVLADKPLLIKNLNNLYTSKGSELSFKLLFRILFNATTTLKQPYEYVLKPSDGTWVQEISLRLRLVSGSFSDINNRNLHLQKSGAIYRAPIYRIKYLQDDLYEVFLNVKIVPPYEINDEVYVEDADGIIFEGTIDPTTTTFEIITGGSGFKAGQIFIVNLYEAVNSVVQIISVDSVGAITNLKFISYGHGFTEDTISLDLYNDLTIASRSYGIVTKTNSVQDQFQMVLKYLGTEPGRYFLTDYVEVGYNGELLAEITSNPGASGSSSFSTSTVDPTAAVISFGMGAVGRYPGQFNSNKGFLSEPEVRLQDDELYQPFAYQLENELDISKFYDIVKSLIHPAGTNLFNNRLITANASIKANVSVITRANINNEVFSILDIYDTRPTLEISKLVADTTTALSSPVLTTYKPVTDSTTPSDSQVFNLNRTETDSATISDTVGISTRPVANDSVSLSDTSVKSLGININNTDSTVTFTESVFCTFDNYAEAGYFAERYAGETTQLL